MRRSARRIRRGYSLAELMLGASIVALFMVGVYERYSATDESTRFTQFMEQATLMSGIALSNDLNESAVVLNNNTVAPFVPKSMTTGGVDSKGITVIKSVYRETLDLSLQQVSYGDGILYPAIEISTKVPGSACSRIVLGQPTPFTLITINGGTMKPFSGYSATTDCGKTTTETVAIQLLVGRNVDATATASN